MSKIDDLITELCPGGVASLSIADIAEVGTGSSDKKDSAISGLFPMYVRSKNVERSDTFEFDETAIIIPGEGGVGEIFPFASGKYALHQRAYRIAPVDSRVNPKFLFYAFKVLFKDHISSKAVSATVTSIRRPMITSFIVPVPPLEVQREIVSILDKFTQLEAELEAELEARRSQYEHYRREVLTFGQGVEWVALSDVADYTNGKAHERLADPDGDVPMVTARFISRNGYRTFRCLQAAEIPR